MEAIVFKVVGRDFGGNFRQQVAIRWRGDGDIIDDTAGRAHTLNGIGTVNHLDAVDKRGVDGESATLTVAQGSRLRNIVE